MSRSRNRACGGGWEEQASLREEVKATIPVTLGETLQAAARPSTARAGSRTSYVAMCNRKWLVLMSPLSAPAGIAQLDQPETRPAGWRRACGLVRTGCDKDGDHHLHRAASLSPCRPARVRARGERARLVSLPALSLLPRRSPGACFADFSLIARTGQIGVSTISAERTMPVVSRPGAEKKPVIASCRRWATTPPQNGRCFRCLCCLPTLPAPRKHSLRLQQGLGQSPALPTPYSATSALVSHHSGLPE